jgi:hypothetical protein
MITISALHQRYLTSSTSTPTFSEYHHWSRAVYLFNEKLNTSIAEEDCDAVFATGTLLNGISFAWTQTSEPRSSWPMVSPAETDCLQWLCIQRGFKLLIPIARPFRQGSLFYAHSHDSMVDHTDTLSNTRAGNDDFPLQFVELCSISPSSTVDSNPYYAPLRLLAPLLKISCTRENMMKHLNFTASIPPEFLQLLRRRDERALLILSYWYGLILQASDAWWLLRRARLECMAICMYLDENSNDERLRELLRFPAEKCGYRVGVWQGKGGEQVRWFVPGGCTPM